MAHVLFFEKPGCANNTRQKAWLQAAGHVVEARSLLTHPWTKRELLSYFGDRPVALWINRAAPRVKSGEIVPEHLDAETALELMLSDPLFIRRPLLLANGRREVGFDVAAVHAWLGLPAQVVREETRGAEACIKPVHAAECPEPKAG